MDAAGSENRLQRQGASVLLRAANEFGHAKTQLQTERKSVIENKREPVRCSIGPTFHWTQLDSIIWA